VDGASGLTVQAASALSGRSGGVPWLARAPPASAKLRGCAAGTDIAAGALHLDHPIMTPPAAPPARSPRALLLALAWLAITSLLLGHVFTPNDGGAILRLELAPAGAAFAQAVLDDWVQEAADPANPRIVRSPWCGLGLPHVALVSPASARAPVLDKLRCNLVVDSVGLVPGYVGLLLLFTLAAVPAGWRPALRWGCAAAAVAAGACDLAENYLTWRALDALQLPPLITARLPDEGVAAVRHVSQAKWLLIALANALLGHLLFWHGAGSAGPSARRAAALMLPGAAVLLAVGALAWRPGISAGMGLMMAALVVLGWRMWRYGG
jgi:hypothetical protein